MFFKEFIREKKRKEKKKIVGLVIQLMFLSRSRNNEDYGRFLKEILNFYLEKVFIKNRFLKIFLNYLKYIESSI